MSIATESERLRERKISDCGLWIADYGFFNSPCFWVSVAK
jgi:hypothetical protein